MSIAVLTPFAQVILRIRHTIPASIRAAIRAAIRRMLRVVRVARVLVIQLLLLPVFLWLTCALLLLLVYAGPLVGFL
jgi:hypothetical protein